MAELEVKTETTNKLDKKQLVELVGDILGGALQEPVLSRDGLRWSGIEKGGEANDE